MHHDRMKFQNKYISALLAFSAILACGSPPSSKPRTRTYEKKEEKIPSPNPPEVKTTIVFVREANSLRESSSDKEQIKILKSILSKLNHLEKISNDSVLVLLESLVELKKQGDKDSSYTSLEESILSRLGDISSNFTESTKKIYQELLDLKEQSEKPGQDPSEKKKDLEKILEALKEQDRLSSVEFNRENIIAAAREYWADSEEAEAENYAEKFFLYLEHLDANKGQIHSSCTTQNLDLIKEECLDYHASDFEDMIFILTL